MDWHDWHRVYDDPDSVHARRLLTVRARIGEVLDAAPPGTVRVVSVCAGQGHDLLGVLAAHPRRADVRARLVERDPRNAAAARATVAGLGLGERVEVVTGDAALVRNYADVAPAALVLLCGVLGNVADEGMEDAVDRVSRLCAPGGTLVWTRNRKEPDRVPRVCAWLEARGFTRDSLSPPDVRQAVAAHRRTGPAAPLPPPDAPMFDFVGYDVLAEREGRDG
ncbi:class I SAM-dependent methyltransferase family protein [Streptomyces sp. SID11385]|uniref:class I SAM-dependent methyltransferase family protein n=1 Tax=Streptomyces sp. SID11385 TaxID=2706031 RepID=UPI0013C90CCE|nr:class I SAM-dependent methyltransferase family protein [Streptomyces sp. SID11385]NEA39495.1 SAM-dependent methyltransferase [Streptomyces sp. SID11385]